ncbi:hypothetical protein SAMN04487996_12518 [Dyadobacter soli]|uniref:Uncharacterized protein n=1 Tax=Dyadobacter soli TaxID=659014 RepID=A0A1G7Y0D3_9BACT|nr:hypothetical protein [Dyadobacter soli]SDG89925.1 hypothetical protein SAMN04487996_12518 [Dyadobacter soli]
MKKICFYLLVLLASACKEDEKFDPNSYNGEYPRNLDGSKIETHDPTLLGGEIESYFNGHSWDHAPFLSVYINRFDPPQTATGEPEILIGIYPMLTAQQIESCLMESFVVRAPLKVSTTSLNEFTQLHTPEYAHVKFTSMNCDAGKDQYMLDRSKESTVKVTSYNADDKEVQAEYDVYFRIAQRNSTFGPIYPEKVHLRGKVKAHIKLL